MDINRFKDELSAGTLTRRDFKKALAGVGLGLVTVPMMKRPARAEGQAKYFGWVGYEDPGFMAPYIEKYGEAPSYTFWGSEDEAFAKLRTGGFTPDVMAPCTYELIRWRDAGLLAELDPSRLEWAGDMFPSLDAIEGVIVDGKRYFIPVDWGNSTIIYRRDLVGPEWSDENVSWDIFYTDEFSGRLGFYDSAATVVEVSALVLGYENIFELTDEQLVEVRKMAEVQRGNVRIYWGDQTEAVRSLASGELVASYGWNSAYVELKAEGYDVGLGVPKEGIFTWCCGLVMHAETELVDEAYDTINAFTSPESDAYEIENWGYGHANKKAFDLVPPETLADLGLSTPEDLLDKGIFFRALAPATDEKYTRLYDEVMAGF